MISVPVLRTDRCILSAVTYKEIPVLRQILDDAETQRFLPELCEVFQTEESLQRFIESFNTYLLQDEGILWGIYSDLFPTLMGFIAIMDITTEPTLFYAMHPANRNQGYAKGSVSEVTNNFQVWYPGLNLHTEVYNDNLPSIYILQSCGFKVSGNENEKMILTI